MIDPPEKRGSFDELRLKAERILAGKENKSSVTDSRSLVDLIQEVEVQQAELQLQNEELREIAKKLEASQRRYSELYQFAPVGYVTVDIQGLIAEANQAACRMLGLPLSRLTGR
ncbi:MAG: PAS domain-containing protein, partial [Desulfoferrobacter sp.]